MFDDYMFEPDDEPLDYDDFEEELDVDFINPALALASKQPMFQVLFAEAVTGDPILEDFAEYVVGELSDRFALKAAKGGAFFQAREAEGMKNTQRFQHDQNLRAHLINGLLPTLHIVRHLAKWNAPYFQDWDNISERLFIAGYVLHDYTKIDAVKKILRDNHFKDWEAPSETQMPVLIGIFRDWCMNLGLDAFLESIGGAEPYLEDLIYIACNTQSSKGTARGQHLYQGLTLDIDTLDLVTYLSRLADLIAYVAKTPRDMVAHKTIQKVLVTKLAFDEDLGQSTARFVYHHVAENRGLLLNFIHNTVTDALSNETRIPLLYAPSGVVYLERHDAPKMPDIDELTDTIVQHIRQKAGEKLISAGKGAKRGNTFLQIDDSYNDFFSVSEMILNSMHLVRRYIRNNKTPARFKAMTDNKWTGWDNIPDNFPSDPKDARADQIAEWAGFVEKQFQDRINNDTTEIVQWLLDELGIRHLEADFFTLKSEATKGGLRYWWHWGAVHALANNPPMDDVAVIEWLYELSQKLVDELPHELPESAQANQTTWQDIADYIKRVLTIGGVKSNIDINVTELENYVQSKIKRGGSTCAICGSDYPTRKPSETAVSFQPGVYTQRIRIGASENKRRLCSICATEQLLRQLFAQVDNLPTGSALEAQKVRYLSFYPSYFFTPETLKVVQRAYNRIASIRMSDSEFWRILRQQSDFTNPQFWQRLDNFWLRPSGQPNETKFEKVLQYSQDIQSTFMTIGFRAGFKDISDTESWIIPSFIAFIMAICLDVKVVVSDNDIPLMLEASELPETLWFDGVHASIQELISARNDPHKSEWKIQQRSRLDIDSLGLALARLTAAYLIHLDTEYSPPKEHWQRFTSIASAICESPLYVFHYLKKQDRDDKPITQDKIRRYIAYANLFTKEGDADMSHAQELVRLYRGFYRAKNIRNANSILRPISVVSDALLVADQHLFNDTDSLIEVAHGELYRFMDRVAKGLADGRFPKGVNVDERQTAMHKFSTYFVTKIFVDSFNQDVSALRGKQLNLLKSACEIIYRDAQAQEWADRNETEDTE